MSNHGELIKSGSFNAKFKNTLRDYYSYGFMNYGQLSSSTSKTAAKKASSTTLNEDWTRLTNILGDYFSWSADKSTALFASTDSRRLGENPFHRVYRFCRYNSHDPIFFFNTVLALNPQVRLTDGIDSLELPDAYGENLIRLEDDIKEDRPLSSSQLQCFFSENKEKLFGGDNNTVNSKLKELEHMGLVKDEGEKTGSKRTNHRWKLSSLYIKNIIEAGEKADADFTEHFSAAMKFFSKYYFMGEIGTYILARLGADHRPLFRVKHEYFAQSLNDCNLLDFLYALENKKWCRISYRNSLSGVETELICYPLGIRVSTTGGREYVTFYEPFKRNYSHLRLEFVDTVEFIAEGSIKEGGRKVSLDDGTVQKDIAKALKLIEKTWGAAGPNIGSLDDDPPISEISFDINFYPKTEQFIPARAEREKRIGTVTIKDGKAHFEAQVLGSREMQPWIRSFYSRITGFSDSEGFSVQKDVDEILAQSECERPLPEKFPKRSAKVWGIPEGCVYKTEKKPAYSLIFHEIFGIYYQLMGEILTKIYSEKFSQKTDIYFSGKDLDDIISQVIKAHKSEIGIWTDANLRKEVRELLKSDTSQFMRKGVVPSGMAVRGSNEDGKWLKALPKWLEGKAANCEEAFRPKYSMETLSFGRDLCPLTDLEAKWLLTLLDDHKANMFFGDGEITAIKNTILKEKNHISPFKTESIVYFDRYYRYCDHKAEGARLKTIIKAMSQAKTLKIHYLSLHNNTVSGEFKPLAVEYSKRDDVFRVILRAASNNASFTMVLGNIEEITITDSVYDTAQAAEDLEKNLEHNRKSVVIEFYDSRNLADRILSEFSPCEKICSYDPKTELYTLTVFYQRDDELEMVIRLMGYGSEISIKDTEHPIYREIEKRLFLQKALCENDKDK